jgi:hypothetical protein
MAKLVEIDVTIELGGKVKIDAKGFTGDACLKETASLEEALGKVSGRDMKPESNTKTKVADITKVRT